jgi:D-alanyl-D-alanine carboxypeptidase/D-alanyl-D-alanine-endopeptidase (penicillin-binding protein 4)
MSLVVSVGVTVLWVLLVGTSAALGGTLPVWPDPIVQTAITQYLHDASPRHEAQALHGVWLQSDHAILGHYQGTVPLPVASLTKIATSLAALYTWGPTYQFMTLIAATGPIRNGVLQGDLVVHGSRDPFFVSEDAAELRRALRQLGVRRVAGKLIIAGDFYMNFTAQPALAGRLLKQALQGGETKSVVVRDKSGKTRTVQVQQASEASVMIAGPVQIGDVSLARQTTPLIRHRSLPLVQILKRMNVYSNNAMAEMLTEALGGSQTMMRRAIVAAGVSIEELRLINGSGLGTDNQISPRAVCALLMAIHHLLRPAHLTIADAFPVAGHDQGTIRRRHLPPDTVVKTGTLRSVKTLAGVMLTRTHGPVWFALITQGEDLGGFREQQDVLLQSLMRHWGAVGPLPTAFSPTGFRAEDARNDILLRTKGEGG